MKVRERAMPSTRYEGVYHAAYSCQAASLPLTAARLRGLKWVCRIVSKKTARFFALGKRPPWAQSVRGCVCKSQPEHDRGKSDHRQEIDRPLLIASRDAPKLLEPIDQAFDVIPLFVQGPVKRPGARLIAAARNGIANSSALEIVPNLATAVSFISQDPLWPQRGTTSSHPHDRALLHQHLHGGGLMALTSREHKGHRFAFAFCTQMQLRAKTTLTLA